MTAVSHTYENHNATLLRCPVCGDPRQEWRMAYHLVYNHPQELVRVTVTLVAAYQPPLELVA